MWIKKSHLFINRFKLATASSFSIFIKQYVIPNERKEGRKPRVHTNPKTDRHKNLTPNYGEICHHPLSTENLQVSFG